MTDPPLGGPVVNSDIDIPDADTSVFTDIETFMRHSPNTTTVIIVIMVLAVLVLISERLRK